MKKIFLDTDIGGDIDDALALYFILNAPEVFELTGIATNFVDAGRRAQLAKHICHLFGKDEIPVAAGFDKPLTGTWDKKSVSFQSDALEKEVPYESMHGVELLLAQAAEHPDMDIVAIGPLTNIAAAILREPSLAKNHTFTIMGGMVTTARPEWNIICDPEAARILFNSGAKVNMFGLDVTWRCQMSRGDVDCIKNKNTEKHDFLSRILTMHEGYSHHLPYLHDPLAVSYYLYKEHMAFRTVRVAVETRGEFTRGTTIDMDDWNPMPENGPFPEINVCVDVNGPDMVRRITEVITR